MTDPYAALLTAASAGFSPVAKDIVAVAALVCSVLVALAATAFVIAVIRGEGPDASDLGVQGASGKADAESDTGALDGVSLASGDVDDWLPSCDDEGTDWGD